MPSKTYRTQRAFSPLIDLPFVAPLFNSGLSSSSHSDSVQANYPIIWEVLNRKISDKTKPLGALGRLEDIALQIGLIQDTSSPELRHPHALVFAGDHGLAREGVSAYPQAVTWQMVLNFLNGGAAISVFAREAGLTLRIVDAGVNYELPEHPDLIRSKINWGTKSILHEPAMTHDECRAALSAGRAIIDTIDSKGCNVVCLGEMGIGNTSSASLITASLLGVPIHSCVGRGTGLNDAQLKNKVRVLEQIFARYSVDDPLEMLAIFGGFEIVMMTGAILQAASRRMVIVIDGFVASAALGAAAALEPSVVGYCIASHKSHERAHGLLLEWLELTPLLDLGMRLGEGTGAALSYPLVRSAVAFLNDMASFESAQVATAS
jgi:nicotinate-nucleotide--dimethylbenzimidazole phosphoribosyltransferase